MGRPLTLAMLAAVSENPDPALYDLDGDLDALVPRMIRAKITTPPRVRMFLANVAQETDHLKTLEEYGNRAYFESFLGNQWRYHGRGYIMNTWKTAYAQLAEILEAPLLNNPDLLANDKNLAAEAAVWYWSKNACNIQADRGNFEGVCSLINRGEVVPRGAINGWSVRQHFFALAKKHIPADLDLEGNRLNAPKTRNPAEKSIDYMLRLLEPQTVYGFWDGKFPFTPGPAMWANVKIGNLPAPKTEVPNASCTGLINLGAAAGGSTYRGGTLAYAKDLKNKRPFKLGMMVRKGEVLLDRFMETSKEDEGHIIMAVESGTNPKVISSDHRFGGNKPGVNLHRLAESYKLFDYDWIGEVPGLGIA